MISVCPWVYPHLILNGFALKWLWTVKFKIGISMRALMTLHICFSFTVFLNDCQYLVHYQILWKKFPYCNIRLYNSLEVASHNKQQKSADFQIEVCVYLLPTCSIALFIKPYVYRKDYQETVSFGTVFS